MESLDYKPDFLNCGEGEMLSVEGVSGQFEWIGRQNQPGTDIPMTALRSINPNFHGLEIGDRVRVTVTDFIPGSIKWDRSGVYGVQGIKDFDDNSYDGELIIIHQNIFGGETLAEKETASGTWEKVDKSTPLTPYYCKPGMKLDPTNSFCILDVPGCLPGFEIKDGKCVESAGYKLPSWAIWVGVGILAVGGFIWYRKLGRKK